MGIKGYRQGIGALILLFLTAGCGGSNGSINGSSSGGSQLVGANGFVLGGAGSGGDGGLGDVGGPRNPGPGNGIPAPFQPGGGTTGGATGGTSGGTTGGTGILPQFRFYVTESPPGPQNQNPANRGGVLGFRQQTDGSTTPITGISSSDLGDPAGIVLKAQTSEAFVSNRLGNNRDGGSGLPGNVSRFNYDPNTGIFTPISSFATTGPAHQANFNPISGELFVATVGADSGFPGGVDRFTFNSNGDPVPNGTLAVGTTARGVVVSEDGDTLYFTSASGVIRQVDLATGTISAVTVPGATNLHYMAIRDGELYAADVGGNVLRFTLTNDVIGLPPKETIPAAAAIAVAFSPDGTEMLVTGHRTSTLVRRFLYNAQSDSWTELSVVDSGSSLGGIMIVP